MKEAQYNALVFEEWPFFRSLLTGRFFLLNVVFVIIVP